MADAELPAEYTRADEEYALAETRVRAGTAAKLTQPELARRFGTTQSAFVRPERWPRLAVLGDPTPLHQSNPHTADREAGPDGKLRCAQRAGSRPTRRTYAMFAIKPSAGSYRGSQPPLVGSSRPPRSER